MNYICIVHFSVYYLYMYSFVYDLGDWNISIVFIIQEIGISPSC